MASIRLEGVSVAFPIYDASSRSLKKRLMAGTSGGRIGMDGEAGQISIVQALDGIDLKLEHGDRVALVGHNGSGKTTLLRVMAGIYEPAAGTVKVDGHVAPLFDISLGMNPEATGYQNIYLRGLFLGQSRRTMDARVEEIAAFTELGDFLDLPIRTYSAGMRTRLAFAVSTSFDPDILLLDEGIGAGDAAFLEKAARRMQAFTAKAAIIVLASHAEALVRDLCDKAVLLEKGRIVASGAVDAVLGAYHAGIRGH